MNDSSQSINESRKRLAADFGILVKDAEQLLAQMANEAGEGYGEARERLERKLSSARAKLDELQDSVMGNAGRARDAADAYVRRNPWESIGIGAAVGLVLGMLIARK